MSKIQNDNPRGFEFGILKIVICLGFEILDLEFT